MDGLRMATGGAAWETMQIVLCRNRNGVGSGPINERRRALRRVAEEA